MLQRRRSYFAASRVERFIEGHWGSLVNWIYFLFIFNLFISLFFQQHNNTDFYFIRSSKRVYWQYKRWLLLFFFYFHIYTVYTYVHCQRTIYRSLLAHSILFSLKLWNAV